MAEPRYLSPDAPLPYCRGCGHALVVRHLSRALERLGLPERSVVLTTDIGCVGLADSLFPYLHTVHTTHGRSTAFATGMALAESLLEPRGLGAQAGLKPIVLIGDGGAMIGLLHLVHAAQLNVDVTVLVHNNFLFGMTGGQHSALTPLNFVTATTPEGNWTPPLDLLTLLRTAHAGFLARQFATSSELDTVIADAIDFPGFSLVEIVELCPTYGTRWNQLTGAGLEEIVQRQGYWTGEMEIEQERPTFLEARRHEMENRKAKSEKRNSKSEERRISNLEFPVSNFQVGELRVVVAGTAGERVQSAAALFCRAALAAGLYTTQKNDNPVTQGTGFSLSEICLSQEPIEYTGMETPDVVLVLSRDGWKELRANGTLEHCRAETLLFLDSDLAAGLPAPYQDAPLGASARDWEVGTGRPESSGRPAGRIVVLPFRREATPKGAALAAFAAWLGQTSILPAAAWDAALSTLSPERRAEANQAIEVGRSLANRQPATS
jgi:pyruvate/2-oxoacid:ferredoxin oxidoreductase beta subunit/Pyruvate/2-oxoacid:ferredoxin oxidoreductase gamma subunit